MNVLSVNAGYDIACISITVLFVEAPRIFPMFPAFFIINILFGPISSLNELGTQK
jgi:hypothetical protein